MKIGVPRETAAGERRVALVPDVAAKLVKSGLEVLIERDAGRGAFFSDQDYEEAGAVVWHEAHPLYGAADIVLKVAKPNLDEAGMVREGALLVSFVYPQENHDLVQRLAERRITTLAMDLVPRSTKAQGMDALTSMAALAGYKAVLLGAAALGRIFPMMVTAAGTLKPARVLVLGAGVAGLQAIATARRLGAVVSAFDIRPAVKEEVESLGARFIEADLGGEKTEEESGYARELSQASQERALGAIHRHLPEIDLAITTALVPGKRAPLLISEAMLGVMKRGAVIVDLAAEMGGNCARTEAGRDVVVNDVTILAPVNVASTVPVHASEMYSRNIAAVVGHVVREGRVQLALDDAITREMCVTHEGRVLHELTRRVLEVRSTAP